jgi:hypothetical protein
MKNKELLSFFYVLERIRPELEGRIFNHAVILNHEKAEPYAAALLKAKEPKSEYKKYIEEKEKIKQQYAVKDDKGKYMLRTEADEMGIERKLYTIPGADDPNSNFNKEIQALNEEYKDVILENEEMLKEWEGELLEQESSFKAETIPFDEFPDNINQYELRGLKQMIE